MSPSNGPANDLEQLWKVWPWYEGSLGFRARKLWLPIQSVFHTRSENHFFFFFNERVIYLFQGVGTEREREKVPNRLCVEHGLNPTTLRSQPEPKQRVRHPTDCATEAPREAVFIVTTLD